MVFHLSLLLTHYVNEASSTFPGLDFSICKTRTTLSACSLSGIQEIVTTKLRGLMAKRVGEAGDMRRTYRHYQGFSRENRGTTHCPW